MDKYKWIALMNAFGFHKNESEFEMIQKYHNESHRKYHNTVHIADCLDKCALNEETKQNHVLHLAFWYHDVIYNPLKKDNELKSAEMAVRFLKKQDASQELITNVNSLIMATLHNRPPKNEMEAYIMDIDISILGSSSEDYSTYTENIRKEYKWVPWFLYKKKRMEILEMFLKRDTLYFTEYFKCNFEDKARKNIKNEINKLKG